MRFCRWFVSDAIAGSEKYAFGKGGEKGGRVGMTWRWLGANFSEQTGFYRRPALKRQPQEGPGWGEGKIGCLASL